MEIIKLSSRKKDSGNPKFLIKNNKIPAVIYGKNTESQPVSIDSKLLKKLLKDRGFYSKILSVELNGAKEKVLPKDIVMLRQLKLRIMRLKYPTIYQRQNLQILVSVQQNLKVKSILLKR